MSASSGWHRAEVVFRAPLRLGADGTALARIESPKVRIIGGWVHVGVPAEGPSVVLHSVPADLVAHIRWLTTVDEFEDPAASHLGGLLGPHS